MSLDVNNHPEQLWLPCTLKERADIQFQCAECGQRDFRVFNVGGVVREIRCAKCGHFGWVQDWDDETKLT